MNLGLCDVCFRVASAVQSKQFYEQLGFEFAEGDPAQGWAIMAHRNLRLGLFEPMFMDSDAVSLNFRDGDVLANVAKLRESGIEPVSEPKIGKRGCSASFRDPDGHLIFLDSANLDLS